jgi:hypothetical protein
MSKRKRHSVLINEALEPYGVSIDQKEVILKKNADIINMCLRQVRNENHGLLMLDMIIGFDDHVETGWFCSNILDDENKRIVHDEGAIKFPGLRVEPTNASDLDILE